MVTVSYAESGGIVSVSSTLDSMMNYTHSTVVLISNKEAVGLCVCVHKYLFANLPCTMCVCMYVCMYVCMLKAQFASKCPTFFISGREIHLSALDDHSDLKKV